MTTETPAEQQLTRLNLEIERLEVETTHLRAEAAARSRDARRAERHCRYLAFLRWLRAPSAHFSLWTTALLLLGPLACGAATLIVVNLLTGSYPAAFFAFLLGIVAGVGMFATFVYHPSDTHLPHLLAEAESARRVAQARLEESATSSSAAHDRLRSLLEERRGLMASGKVQRAALLQREWKTMREAEWDDFVVEVCRTLGATVERAGRALDESGCLIATFGDRRVAIRTHGDGHTVNSSAVQQAISVREKHLSDSCALVINRRFTGAAQDFAKRNDCRLIGIDEFPDFVLGKTTL